MNVITELSGQVSGETGILAPAATHPRLGAGPIFGRSEEDASFGRRQLETSEVTGARASREWEGPRGGSVAAPQERLVAQIGEEDDAGFAGDQGERSGIRRAGKNVDDEASR